MSALKLGGTTPPTQKPESPQSEGHHSDKKSDAPAHINQHYDLETSSPGNTNPVSRSSALLEPLRSKLLRSIKLPNHEDPSYGHSIESSYASTSISGSGRPRIEPSHVSNQTLSVIQDHKEGPFVAWFAHWLASTSGAHYWGQYALTRSTQAGAGLGGFQSQLNDILLNYNVDVAAASRSRATLLIAGLVHETYNDISARFIEEIQLNSSKGWIASVIQSHADNPRNGESFANHDRAGLLVSNDSLDIWTDDQHSIKLRDNLGITSELFQGSFQMLPYLVRDIYTQPISSRSGVSRRY